MEFQPGDIVIRINEGFLGVREGDVHIVDIQLDNLNLKLKDVNGTYSVSNFRLYQQEVTQPQPVPIQIIADKDCESCIKKGEIYESFDYDGKRTFHIVKTANGKYNNSCSSPEKFHILKEKPVIAQPDNALGMAILQKILQGGI